MKIAHRRGRPVTIHLAMPTTVSEILCAASLTPSGVVRWGEQISVTEPGVYIVSLTARLDRLDGCISDCRIAIPAVSAWIKARGDKFTLDGKRPTATAIANRISRFWLADETVLYIGRAPRGIAGRVSEFYRTHLGARSPHAGGHWIQTLANRSSLHVHFAESSAPAQAELKMLKRFCRGVSSDSLKRLYDPHHPFPFANLSWPVAGYPRGDKKQHGFKGHICRD